MMGMGQTVYVGVPYLNPLRKPLVFALNPYGSRSITNDVEAVLVARERCANDIRDHFDWVRAQVSYSADGF